MPNHSVFSNIEYTQREDSPAPPLKPAGSLKLKTKRANTRQTDTSSVLRMRNNFQNYQDVW
jgi:hypothetical protein